MLRPEAVRDGDKLAVEIVQKAGERLGVRISFLVNLMNPGAVVIGGGIEAAGPVLIEAIKKMVRLYAFEEMANAVKIVPARLGEDCVALGAASLVIRDVFASV
jgi:glucokinase